MQIEYSHFKSADFSTCRIKPNHYFLESASLADDVTGHLTINGVTKPKTIRKWNLVESTKILGEILKLDLLLKEKLKEVISV